MRINFNVDRVEVHILYQEIKENCIMWYVSKNNFDKILRLMLSENDNFGELMHPFLLMEQITAVNQLMGVGQTKKNL